MDISPLGITEVTFHGKNSFGANVGAGELLRDL